MARIRNKDTKPERIVRSYLHRQGLRFRIHRKDLPGKPDIVFPSRRLALFVHGCFWHGHQGCKKATIPKTRTEFWVDKIQNNQARDERNRRDLEKLGWSVLEIWQCEIKNGKLEKITEIIRSLK